MGTEVKNSRAVTVRTQDEQESQLRGMLNSLTDEEKELVLRAVSGDLEAIAEIDTALQLHYREQPVDAETFFSSEYYVGAEASSIYPAIRQTLVDIFDGDYSEAILTGGIGVGKTTLACYAALYAIYMLWCLADPARSFGLSEGETVYFTLMGVDIKQVRRTIYKKLCARLESSPWFQENVREKMPKTVDEVELFEGVSLALIRSDSDAAIGMDVYFAIMDEVNFAGNSRMVKVEQSMHSDKAYQTQAERNYNSLNNRIRSRFTIGQRVAGKLFVISSKNTDSDFTDKRIALAKFDPYIYVYDKVIWEVKPGIDMSNTFRVFFGGKNLASRILQPGEEVPQVKDETCMVIDVPAAYRPQFEADLVAAIRDIAGVSVPNIMLYFNNRKRIGQMFDEGRENPFNGDHWVCGHPDTVRWDEICRITKYRHRSGFEEEVYVPRFNPGAVRHIHIDPSKNKDSTGFAIGHVIKYVEVGYVDSHTGEMRTEQRPLICIDLALEIRAPKYGEISLDDITGLIYQFVNHGFPIGYISMDTWQTLNTVQRLNQSLCKAEQKSLDRTMIGYEKLKDAVYQQRILCHPHSLLKEELETLMVNNVRGKVDHQPDGSKDVADAVAGVVWSLTERVTNPLPLEGLNKPQKRKIKHPLDQWVEIGNPNGRPSREDRSRDDGFVMPFILG